MSGNHQFGLQLVQSIFGAFGERERVLMMAPGDVDQRNVDRIESGVYGVDLRDESIPLVRQPSARSPA